MIAPGTEMRTAASGDPQLDGRILLGVDEGALAPFGIDPRQEPHLYLYGDAGMGKSSFLRGIVREITRLYQPNEAKIFVVDYRRSLLGDIPEEYLGAYLTSHELASGGMNDLAGFFAGRIPGPDVTPAQLRDRSWWKGAEGFILVDDYDLVATATDNPLLVLLFYKVVQIKYHKRKWIKNINNGWKILFNNILGRYKN